MDYAKPTDRPAIGTPAAALESCVTLISAVTGQPETLMGYYLDLYFQVRSQAEAAEARERLLADLMAVPGELAPLTLETPEAPKADTSSAPATDTSSGAAAPDKPGVSRVPRASESSPQEEGKTKAKKKVDFEEVLASASAGAKMPPEKKKAEPWGSVKREIRERFIALRAKGMTIPQTVNLSGKKLTDGDVMNIMNGGKAEMKIYTALEDAMNKWEKVTASKAADTSQLTS